MAKQEKNKWEREKPLQTFRCCPFFYWKFNAWLPWQTSHFSVNFRHFLWGTNWIWIVLSQVPFSLSLFTLGAIFGAALSIWNFAFVLGNCSIFLPEVPSIQSHSRTHTHTRTWQQLCSIARVAIDFCLCVSVCVCVCCGQPQWAFGTVLRSTGQLVNRSNCSRLFSTRFPLLFSVLLCRFYAKLVRQLMRWAISLMPQQAEDAVTRSNDFIQVVIAVREGKSG